MAPWPSLLVNSQKCEQKGTLIESPFYITNKVNDYIMNTIKEHDLIDKVSNIAEAILNKYLIDGKLRLPKTCKEAYFKIDVSEYIKQPSKDNNLRTSEPTIWINTDDEGISIIGELSIDQMNQSLVDSMNNPITAYKSYETYKDKNGDWAWLSKEGVKSDIGWSWIDDFKQDIESVKIDVLPFYINKKTGKLEIRIRFKIVIKEQ